jgi:hypothetical protein
MKIIRIKPDLILQIEINRIVKKGILMLKTKISFLLLVMITFGSCAASKVTSSNTPRFKVSVKTNSGKTLIETKKDIDVSDSKYQGIQSIQFEVTNCSIYQSYTAKATNIDTGKEIDSISETDNKSSSCTLFTLSKDRVKDEGIYEVSFSGTEIGSKDPPKTIEGHSLDVIYKPGHDTYHDPAFSVTVVTDKGTQTLNSDTTITNTIQSIAYTLTNASDFKSYNYEIKRDSTSVKKETGKTGSSIATISGADVASEGTYTLTFSGTYSDGTQSKEFSAYKINYSPSPPDITKAIVIKVKDKSCYQTDTRCTFRSADGTYNYSVYVENPAQLSTISYELYSGYDNKTASLDTQTDFDIPSNGTLYNGSFSISVNSATLRQYIAIKVTSLKDKKGKQLITNNYRVLLYFEES